MVFDNKTEISQSPIAFGLYSTRKYLLCGYIKVCLGQTISLQGDYFKIGHKWIEIASKWK